MSVLKKSLKLIDKIPQKCGLVGLRQESWWAEIEAGPPDVIFGVTEAYRADSNPKKVLLGVGAYRTDDGKPFILPSVQRAEDMIKKKKLDHEYLPQGGYQEFTKAAARLSLGEGSCILKNGLNLTVQALGGTGAIRLGMAFLSRFYPGCKVVYIPNPTWNNHKNVCLHSGLEWKFYKYYSPELNGIDFCRMCEDIKNIPEKSIILFHAIAHNPTGFDPTPEQWKELSQLCMERNLFVFFDMAYQGFATGDVDKDASSVRQFIDDGHKIAIAQSFSKNMGLYGERIGAFTLVTTSKEELARMNSQLKIVVRAMYSNPPLYGARIVAHVLNENPLRCQWLKDIKGMAERIRSVRRMLVDGLKNAGSEKDWDHITKQIGMFSYTGETLLLGINQTYTLGRSRRNSIHLKDVTVNNKHATLKTSDHHVELQDDNSVSGTWVNNERINKPFRLKTGDLIVFGKEDCKYVFLDPKFEAVIDERIEKLTRFALDLTLKNLNVKTATNYSTSCTHYVTKLVTIDSLMEEPILHFLLERKNVITVKYFIDILANISEAPLMPNIYRYMPEIDHFLKSKGIVDINPRKNRSLIFARVIFINFNVAFHDKVCPIIVKCGGDTTIYVRSERFYVNLFQNWNRTVYVAVRESGQSNCEQMTQFSETMRLKGKRFITMEPPDIYIKILKGDPINNFDDPEVVHLPNTLEEVITLDSSDEDDLLPEIEKQIISKPAKQKRRKNNESPPQLLYKAYKPYKNKCSSKKYFSRKDSPCPTLNSCITSPKKSDRSTKMRTRNGSKSVAETRMQHMETGLVARKNDEQDTALDTCTTLIKAYILTCNESLSNSSKTSQAGRSLGSSQESFGFNLSTIGNRRQSTLLKKRPVSVNSQYVDVLDSSSDSEFISTKKNHI